MNRLIINYNQKGFIRYAFLVLSGYSLIFGIYLCIQQALGSNYNLLFYSSLLLIILSVVGLLNLTIWQNKNILVIDNELIEVNLPKKDSIKIEWNDITEIKIGVSYLILKNSINKQIDINLGILKYDDLKNTKSRIIEICEAKNIPFKND